MELSASQMRQLLALEQTLSTACGQIRSLLASPVKTHSQGMAIITLADVLQPAPASRNSNRARSTPAIVEGYIYCIQDSASGFHKVGKTIKPPLYRFGSLQSSTPNKLHFIFSIKVSDVDAAEGAIHLQLAPHHVRGEWFSCHIDEITAAFHGATVDFWSDMQGQPTDSGQFENQTGCWGEHSKESFQEAEREELATRGK
jgi:hypothetical protein